MSLFDPRKVPYSTRESFHAISWVEDGFWLRSLRGGDENTDMGRLLRIEPLGPVEWSLTPEALVAQGAEGGLRFQFDGPNRVVVTGRGLGLRLSSGASKYDYAQEDGARVHMSNARQDMRCEVVVRQGVKALQAAWNGLSADSISLMLMPDPGLRVEIDLFRVLPDHRAPAEGLEAFRAGLPGCLAGDEAGHLLASYILWSAYVPAEGILTRPAVYMSKNWMANIWSWDHCFVARALPGDLAWDQMAVIFDAQHSSGRLPDYLNDRYGLWAFTKPPVHGHTFAQMDIAGHEAEAVQWLERQAAAWLAGPSWQGLPAYRHGNDAGWDNATPFAEGAPVVTPDLATFLILQFEEIAKLWRTLGNVGRAKEAEERAGALFQSLMAGLWEDAGFVARHLDGRAVAVGDSLLMFLPLLLGPRLPADVRARLLAGLRMPGRFLTAHGLATEALTSPLYRANGYWRGPIWAPTTLLFIDALDRCGETGFADDLARRYVDLCQGAGMAENHDAVTGQGLHDPAFAWTSAVYLILAGRLQRLARMTSR